MDPLNFHTCLQMVTLAFEDTLNKMIAVLVVMKQNLKFGCKSFKKRLLNFEPLIRGVLYFS